MRVEAVNSYLSSIPAMDFYPVRPVGRDGEQVLVPQQKPVVPKIRLDTIGKAQLPYDFVPPRSTPSTLNEAETNRLKMLIARQRSRTDYVAYSFPGLLKA